MTAEFDGDWLTAQTLAVLAYSAKGDEDCYQGIVDVLGAVGDRYGDRGTFSLCCSIAAAVAHLDGLQAPPDGEFYGFEVQMIATGEVVSPDQMKDGSEQDLMAGMRFLTAYANQDYPHLNAMFHATPGPVFFGLCMLSGAAVRHKQEKA